MVYNYNTGGAPEGAKNDCAIRAIAIALSVSYDLVRMDLEARNLILPEGINTTTPEFRTYMYGKGFKWVPALDLVDGDTIPHGRVILHTDAHYVAIINGTAQDTKPQASYVSTRGYWILGDQFNGISVAGVLQNRNPLNFEQALNMRRLMHLNYKRTVELKAV